MYVWHDDKRLSKKELYYIGPILRLVTVVYLTSLSILELLEYNFSRKDISRALAKGVIKFDKSSSLPPAPEGTSKEVIYHVPETGDYYFGLLSSKVRLTEVGLDLLEAIEAQLRVVHLCQRWKASYY